MTLKECSDSSWKNLNTRLAVVIPAFNEELTLREVVEETLAYVSKIIVVDDGSTDATAEQLKGLPVEIISNSCNEGKGPSLWRGFRRLLNNEEIDGALTLDGDGQHAPEDIEQLLAEYQKSPDQLIVGLRTGRESSAPPARFFANQFANFWISWAAGTVRPDRRVETKPWADYRYGSKFPLVSGGVPQI